MAEGHAEAEASKSGERGGVRRLKKIKQSVKDAYSTHMDQTIRLMFQDEAGFGRINKPKMCWCPKGVRPSVPCHHIREYEYLYGAVEPMTGENFFLIMPYCNTNHMNAFLRELSALCARLKLVGMY